MPRRTKETRAAGTRARGWWTARWLPLAAVVLLAAPATVALFHTYSIGGFDTEYHIVALAQFDRCLRDGQVLARWLPDMAAGFGYPLFIYYPPLIYVVAWPFVWMGASYATAIDMTIALALVGGALAMFFAVQPQWGRRAGVLAATAYTYAPYHLVTAYVKGAVAELFSFVWAPLVFLALLRLRQRASAVGAVVLAAAYAALMLTNNSSALLFSLLFLPYVALAGIRDRSIRFVIYAVAGLLGGLALSAFFWIPAIFEKDYVQISRMTSGYFDFNQHFVSLPDLLYSPWNYGGSGFHNQFSRMAGFAQWALLVTGIIGLRHREGREDRIFFALAFVCAIAMMLSLSAPAWAAIPLLRFLQFPWKFLGVTTLAASFLCGSVCLVARGERLKWAAFALGVIVILLCDLPHARPEIEVSRPPDFASPADVRQLTLQDMGRNDFTHYYTSYLPVQVRRVPGALPPAKLQPARGLTVEAEDVRTDRYRFRLRLEAPMRIALNTFWFPGWEATVDGQTAPLEPEPDTDRITLTLDRGAHDVALRFGHTPLRRWTLFVSSMTAVVAAAACWFGRAR